VWVACIPNSRAPHAAGDMEVPKHKHCQAMVSPGAFTGWNAAVVLHRPPLRWKCRPHS
jgi:hypothetical protein